MLSKKMFITIFIYLGCYAVIEGLFMGLTLLIFERTSSVGDIVFKVGSSILMWVFMVMMILYYQKNK